jgi:DNA-binding PadR family transcriptional regulator
VAGKVRRLYAITSEGRAELAAERRALAELAREVLELELSATGEEPGNQSDQVEGDDD